MTPLEHTLLTIVQVCGTIIVVLITALLLYGVITVMIGAVADVYWAIWRWAKDGRR